ncbi:MAG: chromosomal replication initiator protein DnaA [Phycisphaerae bacterium]
MAPIQDSATALIATNVRERIGTERWRVWFEGATDFHITDDGVTVGVANLFIGDHIQRRFADEVEAAIRQSLGRNAPVTYRVQPDLFQRRRRENLEGEAEAMERLGQAPQGASPPETQTTSASERPSRPSHAARPLFTLKNFVVGPCNRMAYAAAQAVVNAPGKDFHPLFIHAGCGLGKTHLLQAILNACPPRHAMRVACVSAEQFTNQYLACMRTRRLDAFRHRYRSLDVLAIDDVHFLAGKAATQEEFLHTFNELDDQGRLVVLASDSHPRDMAEIQDRLISRWVAGLVVRMTPPDRDTRRRLLEAKAVQMGHPLPSDVLDLLADRLGGSVRDLEGALTRLIACAALLKTPITPDLARRVAAEVVTAPPERTGLEAIEQGACAFFAVTPADIRSRRKARPISLARQATMVLAREMTDLSLSEIARGLGSKHHTTVLSACRKWRKLVANGTEVVWTDRDQRRAMSAEALLAHLRQRLVQ